MRGKVILFVGCILAPAFAAGSDFGLLPDGRGDTVYFRSSAKLEFIQGMTNDITGGFRYDPAKPSATLGGVLRVDLRTLKTGIETRDEHMRNRHLHTEQFPYAYFELLNMQNPPSLAVADSTYTATVDGYFYIHGVKRRISSELELTRKTTVDDESIAVRGRFELNLDDFKIDRPKALFLKLAETIEVEVVFVGHESTTGPAFDLPQWQELR